MAEKLDDNQVRLVNTFIQSAIDKGVEEEFSFDYTTVNGESRNVERFIPESIHQEAKTVIGIVDGEYKSYKIANMVNVWLHT